MSLIDKSYFIGEKNIPNTDYVEVVDSVNTLIGVYERRYLDLLMGYDLSKLFVAGIAEGSPAQKWLDIKNGVEFTGLDGRLKKWNGFVDTATFESPIAYYCYNKYLKNNATQTAEMGEVNTLTQNSTKASSRHKQCNAWNKMVEMNKFLHEFLVSKYDVYPEYQLKQYTSESRSLFIRQNPYGI